MKWAGKRMTVVITGVVAALFLCTLAVMLVRSTYKIQGTMQEEVLDLCTEAADRITAMAESAEAGETREERIFHYQQAMADNDMGFSGSYPFRCVSALGSIGGESVPVYSRNGVFLSIVWKDGREEHISAVFAHENSADVAQVLLRNQFIYDGVFQMTGYRENGWFYVQTMDYGYGERYESPYEAPEGAQLEEIRLVFRQAGGVGEYKPEPANAKSVGIVPVLKYYGGTDQTAPFVKQWETDDALLEELLEEGFAVEGAGFAQMGAMTEIKERTIFRTKIKVRERMKDSMQLSGENYMYVGYLAEFSPLALAARELWVSWVPLILLVLFVACGLFLNTTYNYVRQREVRAYRDEIARQTQALEYAKNAESSRREMTSAIAHELKTPIAVLSSYAEALQENIDAEKQSHYLAVIREETGKMDPDGAGASGPFPAGGGEIQAPAGTVQFGGTGPGDHRTAGAGDRGKGSGSRLAGGRKSGERGSLPAGAGHRELYDQCHPTYSPGREDRPAYRYGPGDPLGGKSGAAHPGGAAPQGLGDLLPGRCLPKRAGQRPGPIHLPGPSWPSTGAAARRKTPAAG